MIIFLKNQFDPAFYKNNFANGLDIYMINSSVQSFPAHLCDCTQLSFQKFNL